MQVNNDEIRTARETAREINAIIDQLRKRDVEKIVVMTRNGKIGAVILTPERYDELIADHTDVN